VLWGGDLSWVSASFGAAGCRQVCYARLSSIKEEVGVLTADLLTQRMQVHEKAAWMLRSLLDQ